MGTIAGIAALAAFIGAAAMLILGALGLWHSRKVAPSAEVFTHTGPTQEAIRV
jgi:hypothetical protein